MAPLISAAAISSVVDSLDAQTIIRGIALALILVFVSQFFKEFADGFPYWHIPVVGRSRWELSNTKAKTRFVHSAKELIEEGFREVRGGLIPEAPFFTKPRIRG